MDYTPFFEFEVKTVSETGRFQGYASTFGGSPDRQGDIVTFGAFKDTLAESQGKVPILMGHYASRIVGFGISAAEDSHGLKVTGEFTLDSDEGRNAYATAKHAARLGHNLGLSIGYGIRPGGYKVEGSTRYLTQLDLYEYSIAAVPANPNAHMGNVKCADMGLMDWNRLFRTNGFSKSETEALVHAVKGIGDSAAREETQISELITLLRSGR